MAVAADKTRKMITLPDDLAERISEYANNRGIKSESEAIRRLIEKGLAAEESLKSTFERCVAAWRDNKSPAWITANVLETNPRLVSVTLKDGSLFAEILKDAWLRYDKPSDTWSDSSGREESLPF